MFKSHYDNMRPGPTPERVLALSRLISEKKLNGDQIAQYCALKKDAQVGQEAVKYSLAVAEELDLIENKEGTYIFIGPKDCLTDYASFRRYVSSIVFSKPESTFFKATEWFVLQNDDVLKLNTFENYSAEMVKSGIDKVVENDILGWRFWLRFLGIAYQYDTTLLPNMKIRIQDCLRSVEKEKAIPAVEFVSMLKEQMPEIAHACSNNILPLALSNGLRALQAQGLIELITTLDAVKVQLFPLAGVAQNDFSDVIVKEALMNEMD
jgi:hypothetical protein